MSLPGRKQPVGTKQLAGGEDRRGHPERPARAGGGRPRRGGVPRPEPDDDLRRGNAAHAEAQGSSVRHGGHRALPRARGERGGHGRDVPRGRPRRPHRGRLRASMGLGRVGRHRVDLNGRAFASVEGWRPRPLDGEWPLHQLSRHYLSLRDLPACSVAPSSYLADAQ